jgi:hypothetical protein
MSKKIIITDQKEWEIECQADGQFVVLTAANLEDKSKQFATATLDKQTLNELIDTLTQFRQQMP